MAAISIMVMGLRALPVLALWVPLCGALVASPTVRPRAVLRHPLAVYAHGGAAALHTHSHADSHDGGGGLLEGWMRLKSQHDDLWRAFRRHAKTPSRRARARDYAEGAQITLVGAVLNLVLAVGSPHPHPSPKPSPSPSPNLSPNPKPNPSPSPGPNPSPSPNQVGKALAGWYGHSSAMMCAPTPTPTP